MKKSCASCSINPVAGQNQRMFFSEAAESARELDGIPDPCQWLKPVR